MRYILPLICVIVLFSSCKEKERFPIEPYIEFVSLTKKPTTTGVDSTATLVIHFQDGDGDIGLNENDTISGSPYNFFIDYYKKIDGVFQPIQFEGVTFHQRIPRLSERVPEPIEGDISVLLYINSLDLSTVYDTIKFQCYIVDRALHVSNTIETSELVVKKR